MTPSRNPSVRRPDAIGAALLVAALALAGCGKKEEEQAAQAPPPPPPVETVKAETVEEVVARLGVDKRIRMEESERPASGDAATNLKQLEALLVFFDAMLNAKEDAIKPLLSARDQATLETMIKSGEWKTLGQDVDRVSIGCAGPDVLAVFLVGDKFQGQLWTFVESKDNPDQIQLAAQPNWPNMMDKLSGTTAEPRIKQWMAYTRTSLDESKNPDVPLESAQEDRSVKGEEPASGQPGGTPGKSN
jgi:hypothetical protein